MRTSIPPNMTTSVTALEGLSLFYSSVLPPSPTRIELTAATCPFRLYVSLIGFFACLPASEAKSWLGGLGLNLGTTLTTVAYFPASRSCVTAALEASDVFGAHGCCGRMWQVRCTVEIAGFGKAESCGVVEMALEIPGDEVGGKV